MPDQAIALADPSAANPPGTGAELLRKNLALSAPSAVNPLERNVVINPAHPDFRRIAVGDVRPFVCDTRLR